MASTPTHTPVLYQAVLDVLAPHAEGAYIDATLGGAGHAEGILLGSAPDGRLLGLDADASAVERAQQRLEAMRNRTTLVHGSFRDIERIALAHGFAEADGIIADLGVSSFQLDDPTLGFSFQHDGPLDMRLDKQSGITAAEVVNDLAESQLADILYRYGEEHRSRRIARAIVAARPLTTTAELAAVVSRAVGGRKGERVHPATRTFQALRIYVNDELGALENLLPQALRLLRPSGILAVITFHSLEDRIVKNFMRRESQDCICPPRTPVCQCGHKAQISELFRKGLTPSAEEIAANPRSRSARLRAARKLQVV